MLIFKIKEEQYTITDDYKILGKGQYFDYIKSCLDLKISDSKPSLPCVIDSLYTEFEQQGFDILLYQQEAKKGEVY